MYMETQNINDEKSLVLSVAHQLAEVYNNVTVVNPQYVFLKMNEGESRILLYLGKKNIEWLDKDMAIFTDENGVFYLSNVYNLMEIPDTFINKVMKITYLGEKTFKKDNEVRKIKKFSIIAVK